MAYINRIRYIRQVLDFVLFTNIFIAICASAQGYVTYLLLSANPDKYILAILFCSTLTMYNISILLSKPVNPDKSPYRRVRWIFSYTKWIMGLTLIAGFSMIPLFLFLSHSSQLLLVLLALLSIAYNLPVLTFANKLFNLRNVPGLKLFLIATVWSLSCVLLPIIELNNHQSISISASQAVLLTANRFLFIAAITIPFDIRDLFQDQKYNLKTIPV